MDEVCFLADRPAKRQKFGNDLATESAATETPGYVALVKRRIPVTFRDVDSYKTLQRNNGSLTVEVLTYPGDSNPYEGTETTAIRVNVPSLKQTIEASTRVSSLEGYVPLDDCIWITRWNKKKRATVNQPLVRSSAVLGIEVLDNNAFLEISLYWHDSVEARDKVEPELSEFLHRHFNEHDKLVQPAAWDVKEFYDHVHIPPPPPPPPAFIDRLKIEEVQCQLYPFQDRATRWLLSREGVEVEPSGKIVPTTEVDLGLPLDFREVLDASCSTCYFSPMLNVVCSSRSTLGKKYGSIQGGILAEAMGLGKTVEMIALMCSHTRQHSPLQQSNPESLLETGATLIITPPTILEQWKQEVREHAPSLRVYHYTGIKSTTKNKENILTILAEQDVVLTTYSVIASEIHYVQEKPDRTLRDRPRRERPKSPLTQILWWRCLLDEAQMVESGVSNAAIVARLIPRVNAWAVTGTPLKQSHRDLYGLLLFLRYEPWCQSARRWDQLVFYKRGLFRKLMGEIALRHSKEAVREELRIPPQTRQVVKIPFTAIEESHYAQMHYDMQQDCGLDGTGAPLDGNWDPDDPAIMEKMRSWLQRLRQTCLHPEVGGRNRKALGKRGGGPLRTVAQVLDVMIEQTDTIVHTEQRNVLMARADQARIFEHARESQMAQDMFRAAHVEATSIVLDCRKQLDVELNKASSRAKSERVDEIEIEAEEEEDSDASLTAARQRLRSALEVQHICIFFIGNTYYQLKEREELKLSLDRPTKAVNSSEQPLTDTLIAESKQHEPGSGQLTLDDDVFEQTIKAKITNFEKLEAGAYEEAKMIRTELLTESRRKAQKRIKDIRLKRDNATYAEIPTLQYSEDDYGGIESRKVFEKLYHYCKAMNTQAEQFNTIRKQMTDMLSKVLIDEEEGVELTGDEYEDSTKHQEEMYVVMEILRALFADRSDAISGQENLLLKQETRQFEREAKEGKGPAPDLMLKLLSDRKLNRIDPSQQGSLRGIITEIRSLVSSLEWQESSSERAKAELVIVNQLLQHAQKLSAAQNKSISALEQEVNLFRDTVNARLDYYRALQVISDMVAPIGKDEDTGKPVDQAWIARVHTVEETATKKLSVATSKRRYLLHLKNEQEADCEAKICTICQFEFEIGTLTVCGHQFCKECIKMWWSEHRNCPVCKRRLQLIDFYDVTYKPVELENQEQPETVSGASASNTAASLQTNSIYSTMAQGTLRSIQSIDLRTASYGSKVDTLIRHILHLRKTDPGSKSIVFSQYRDFLDVLSRSLRDNSIIHSKFDGRDGIIDFKTNPANECFLLHAKAHAAGLNLVCASHVILCEPLINTAIELQAVARVHRIGQVRETFVWLYIIENTVEEAISDIAVKRRLEHMDSKSREASRQTSRAPTPSRGEQAIEAANAKELQAADLNKLFAKGKTGGELVDKEDLWSCLFGDVNGGSGAGARREFTDLPAASEAVGAGSEIARHLRAEAVESRM